MIYTDTLMYKEIHETPAALKQIMPGNKAVIEAAVREIKARKISSIIGAARGTSGHALVYFKYLTEIFSSYRVGFAACSTLTVYGGAVNLSDSLVIGVSQSGKAADVLEVLKTANAQGAVTIAVTNNLDSPMAKEAKYHLYCGCGEEKSVAATKTFNAQIYLMTYLAAQLSGSPVLSDALNRLPESLESNIKGIETKAGELAAELKSMTSGFVLGRGITYSIALESALKLQETCYIKLSGYPYSEFQHGPMAMVNGEQTPIIIYAPKIGFVDKAKEESNLSRLKEFLEKMKSLGAKVIIVGGADGMEPYGKVYKVEAENEIISVFKFALFAQLTACALSCLKGNNPDSPRALSKVTVTK